MLLLLLLSTAQARSVTSLTYDEMPAHIEYQPMRNRLALDGEEVSGSRGDKRAYLEAVLPYCAASDLTERRRRARWRAGNILFFGGLGGLVISSFVKPEDQAPQLAFAGVSLVGGAVALTGVSLQRSIRAYNRCASPEDPGAPE